MNESIIELIQGDLDQGSPMIKTQKQEIKLHTVFLDDEIGKPSKYRDLMHNMFTADEHDQFIFMINSPGGYMSAAMSIIEAIKNSEATVRAVLVGECHSAASIIALNCHNIVVTNSAHMMIHTAQFSTGGNTHSIQKHADFSTKMINHILDDTYRGFLTEQELKDTKTGVEFWFDSKEISRRLTARGKYLESASLKKTPKKKQKEEQAVEE